MTAPLPPTPGLPPAELLEPARVSALLELLFDVTVDGGAAAQIAGLVPQIETLASGWRARWAVDGQTVRYYGYRDEPLGRSQFGCSCPAWDRLGCLHVHAVLLAVAWRLDEGRSWFHQPVWALRLRPLLGAPGAVRGATAGRDERWEGWLRYELVHDPGAADPLFAWTVEREVMRLGKRDRLPLKPQRCPASWEALQGQVRGLRDADRELHLLLAEREELVTLHKGRWQAISGRGREILQRLADRVVLGLADMDDVRLGGQPVRVQRAPVWPKICGEGGDRGLALRWSPPVQRVVDMGSGFLLMLDGTLRPLDPDFPDTLRASLGRPLPVIPADGQAEFFQRFVLEGGLPVEIEAAEDLPVFDADDREARVVLDEVRRELVVDLRYAYWWDNQPQLAAPQDPASLVAVEGDEPTWIRRDLAWERAEQRALRELLPEGLPARFSGDAALDFLAERLPELARRFAVFGQDSLIANRLRGTLEPRVRVPSGLDWFDLRVGFGLGDQELGAREVLESWLAGRPYLRLPDGSLAKLPEAWLARHAWRLAQIEDIRRVRREGLGAQALPLAAPLLDEAEGDIGPWRALADALEEHGGVPERPVPAGLNATLRPYQRLGFRWLAFMREHGLGACLADDMGLGKTLQAIALLLDGAGEAPSLVVAPTSVVDNWARECARFAPGLRVRLFHGPDRRADFADADVIITTYGLLRLDGAALAETRWRHVILDEAQAIKNPASKVTRAACALDADHRVALTGTPLENDLLELRSIFQFLMPGFFGSRAAFQRRFVAPIQRQADPEALAELRRRIRPFVLRRLKREVAAELPPRQEQVLRCELPPAQRDLYERVRATYQASVEASIAERGEALSKLHILEALTRLRQACCHPGLLPFEEARDVRGSAKLDLLMETLESAVADGHRSLVFSQWPSLLERVSGRLEARGWPYLLLRGDTRNRGALVDRWNDPDGPPVFLISLKAGGTGLNLTGADHVFHLDPWWNPAAEDQATDRAHRIGQTRPVTVYRLVARGTVEERILALQERKRALFSAALEDDRLDVGSLSRDDLDLVFHGGVDDLGAAGDAVGL
ncbi:MAG: SNF2 helicase associated domain-containing protein [Alphaproteobacteria bacterium]|nr:SNF2 helicase associated domain-containing protein [Alphaproteobacteria bacterium]